MSEVIVADKAGACYGVERALELANKAVRESTGSVYTLGALIHNPQVVESLARQGVCTVDKPEDAEPGATLVMRAHGVAPSVERRAQEAELITVDATCPYVKRVHKAVERLEREGYQVVVVGEAGHPEVEGICGHAAQALVVASADEIEVRAFERRVGVVAQTTLERRVLRDVVAGLVGKCEELRVMDTICAATSERQTAAAELAERADVMIVVGGRGSANTRHLADVCRARCKATYHVEDASELEPSWFTGAQTIGITAGASTPATQIAAVSETLQNPQWVL